jgi:hypothetical protein
MIKGGVEERNNKPKKDWNKGRNKYWGIKEREDTDTEGKKEKTRIPKERKRRHGYRRKEREDTDTEGKNTHVRLSIAATSSTALHSMESKHISAGGESLARDNTN